MEKMLKHNNSLTGINTVLLIIIAWLTYQNHQDIASQHEQIVEFRAALHYKLNTDVPYNNRTEGFLRSKDVALTRKEETNNKQN